MYSNANENLLPLLRTSFPDLLQATISRNGGVSRKDFASNNISFNVGDAEEHVFRNRERIKDQFELERLVSANQVHGERIEHLRAPVAGDCVIEGCDALVTDQPGIGLMIGHADCQAIVLYDPVKKIAAAVHSGWRGSVANIAGKTVAAMSGEYGCLPADIEAGISPSLGPCCAEFVNYREELPRWFWKYLVRDNHFDFWKITRKQLVNAGLRPAAVSCAEICTSCSVDYFSYRRACRLNKGITGRNGTVIVMHA